MDAESGKTMAYAHENQPFQEEEQAIRRYGMPIALSHGGTTMYSSECRSNQVWVGTKEGIVVIERDAYGDGWHVSERMLTDKHISAIHYEENSGCFFVGAFHGSIQVSSDNGRSWEKRDGGLTQTNVYSIASTCSKGRTRIYAGTEPAHLFASDDLGKTWSELPALRSVASVPQWRFPVPPHVAHAKHLSFDPSDPNTVYVCIEVGGLLTSTDAGLSWQQLEGVYEDAHRLVIHPTNGKRMYVNTGRGLYVTSDGGHTFEPWISRPSDIANYPDGLVLHPRNPNLMFLSGSQYGPGMWPRTHYAGARISRSTDGGRTWEILGNGLPHRLQASIEALCLEAGADSTSIFAATTAGDVYCSDDAGDRWARIVSGLAPISKGGHYQQLQAA